LLDCNNAETWENVETAERTSLLTKLLLLSNYHTRQQYIDFPKNRRNSTLPSSTISSLIKTRYSGLRSRRHLRGPTLCTYGVPWHAAAARTLCECRLRCPVQNTLQFRVRELARQKPVWGRAGAGALRVSPRGPVTCAAARSRSRWRRWRTRWRPRGPPGRGWMRTRGETARRERCRRSWADLPEPGSLIQPSKSHA
jgi:hypothetical protein